MKKQRLKSIHLCFIALIILMLGCKKNKEPDCGCNGKIVFTIQDSDEQWGYLYKNTTNDNPNVPDYNYGVWFDEIGCSNCVHTFFICNDIFLNNFTNIPNYPGIQVKFSGIAKDLCKPPFRPADYTYNHIVLTKIQKQ